MVCLGRQRRLAGAIQSVAGAQRTKNAVDRRAGVGARRRMTLQTFVSIAGWVAALLILGAYSLLSFGKILPRSWVYQAMNIVGAAGFIINCAYNKALAVGGPKCRVDGDRVLCVAPQLAREATLTVKYTQNIRDASFRERPQSIGSQSAPGIESGNSRGQRVPRRGA